MTINLPGSADYLRATTPHNSIVNQRPRAVATVLDAISASAAVQYASAAGLRVAIQATGHGVAGDLADDTLLADSSGLDHVVVNPQDRTARVGAGALWRAVNAAAEPHGLLAAAGSAPDVGVAGYTFGGGVGWLTPAFGLASNALLSVTYVDGAGSVRLACEDADDEVDREALWAFRGGGGVGLAVELRFELFPVTDVWAGYQLWPAEHLESVVEAWAAGLSSNTHIATSLSILHAPPGSPFPASLQGRPVIHLAMAAPLGARSADGFRSALADVPTPVVDTWGPADAAALAGIHLDPPTGAPALGMGRWGGAATPQRALRILGAATASETLSVVELRNVGSTSNARPGALTSPPGPFLAASVGVVPTPERRALVASGLEQLRTSLADIDVGRGAVSFAVGRWGDLDALVPEDRRRLERIRAAVDPTAVFHPSRVSTHENNSP
ncbi:MULTISPECIES: FAD-binding oxidoreductase [unclassified Mycobacterium]|uniref:FAD-binding oxidoreductase n=1 Tax=unclassified Mycobacterium TaxID=2642494 RepID=UPI0029C6A600|nr:MULTISPECIES: FAD-binding oxidoreductase [unclassified Mycobacterium]